MSANNAVNNPDLYYLVYSEELIQEEFDGLVKDADAYADLTKIKSKFLQSYRQQKVTSSDVKYLNLAVQSIYPPARIPEAKLLLSVESEFDQAYLSLESLNDTLKNIVSKIIEKIKKLWKMFSTYFTDYVIGATALSKRAQKILDNKITKSTQSPDEVEFVYPAHGMSPYALKGEIAEPDDYVVSYDRLCKIYTDYCTVQSKLYLGKYFTDIKTVLDSINNQSDLDDATKQIVEITKHYASNPGSVDLKESTEHDSTTNNTWHYFKSDLIAGDVVFIKLLGNDSEPGDGVSAKNGITISFKSTMGSKMHKKVKTLHPKQIEKLAILAMSVAKIASDRANWTKFEIEQDALVKTLSRGVNDDASLAAINILVNRLRFVMVTYSKISNFGLLQTKNALAYCELSLQQY